MVLLGTLTLARRHYLNASWGHVLQRNTLQVKKWPSLKGRSVRYTCAEVLADPIML